ncbi:MAG: hypothetical protein V1895_00390 [Parcubacteria group bacterium]
MRKITLKNIYEAQLATDKKLAKLSSLPNKVNNLSDKVNNLSHKVTKLSATSDRVLEVVLQTRDDVADMKPRLKRVEIRSEIAIRSLDRFIGIQKKHETEIAANCNATNRHEQDIERLKVKAGLATQPSAAL